MLSELAIKNFAIIDDLKISFTKGLSILTGETGAGKSIIIEAVNLLLGGRASADLVRTGEKNAVLEARFEIQPKAPAWALMEEQAMDPAEGLMIRRIIAANGRHRIFINDCQATMQLLKAMTRNLAAISSQHAHQALLKEENHLDILDDFAGTRALRQQVAQTVHTLVPLIKEVTHLRENQEKIARENQLIRFQINDIEQAAVKPGEDEELEARRNLLKQGDAIFKGLNQGVNEIYSRESAILERLGTIRSALEKQGHLSPEVGAVVERLSRTMYDLEDISEEMRRISGTIDLDPAAMETVAARLDTIQKLKRKYGKNSLEELFAFLDQLKTAVSGSENMAETIQAMEDRCKTLAREAADLSLALSEKRKEAAQRLAQLAENELKTLEMARIRFTVSVTPNGPDRSRPRQKPLFPDAAEPDATEKKPSSPALEDLLSVNGAQITPTGMDRVSFLMAPNPGEAPRPLARIASGGELSRVVLALKAILSGTESPGTLVFDEVDAGIGGKTADKVGLKLKSLSGQYQLICITHLAQIARYGDYHYKIKKEVKRQRTATTITPLEDQAERIQEVARMMGGSTITQATLNLAAELLQGAAETP